MNTKEYYAKNKEKLRARKRKYYSENREKFKIRVRRHYLKHRGKILTQQKEYYAGKKDEVRKFNQSPKGKFLIYKRKAKERGFTFNISFGNFMFFWQKPCTYCGVLISTIGLDRIDSNKGYVEGNLASCCSFCNTMKRHYDVETFIEQCSKVVEHFSKTK